MWTDEHAFIHATRIKHLLWVRRCWETDVKIRFLPYRLAGQRVWMSPWWHRGFEPEDLGSYRKYFTLLGNKHHPIVDAKRPQFWYRDILHGSYHICMSSFAGIYVILSDTGLWLWRPKAGTGCLNGIYAISLRWLTTVWFALKCSFTREMHTKIL